MKYHVTILKSVASKKQKMTILRVFMTLYVLLCIIEANFLSTFLMQNINF